MLEKIYTNNAPEPIGPYSQAIKKNGFIFLSGQIPINPETNKIESENISDQAKQVFKNIAEILNESNTSFNKVVKTTIFLTDLNNFNIVNDIYSSYFNNDTPPARSTIEVSSLPMKSLIEIELIVCDEK